MKQFILFILLTTSNVAVSQVTVTNVSDPQQLIQNHLIGNPNFPASNFVLSTGTNFESVNGIGTFDGGGSDLPFGQGIVLSTGSITDIPGPNTTLISSGNNMWLGDAELEALTSVSNTFNASWIQFDFVAEVPFISLDFMLASEEYGIFECLFTDVFAFIIKNNSTGTSENIALVPDTITPISTMTVNGLTNDCEPSNMGFFERYNSLIGTPSFPADQSPINLNGQTKVFLLLGNLILGDNYSIKIVIADNGDDDFDSALFVRNSSFGAYPDMGLEPSDLVVEDTNNDGMEIFDLTVNEAQMLGSFDSTVYSFDFSYYYSLADAEASINVIANPETYTNASDLEDIFVSMRNSFTGTAITSQFKITINGALLGTREFESDSIAFYPNPVIDELFIDCNPCNISQMTVYSMSGQVLISQKNIGSTTTLDFSRFPSGVYMVEVISDSGRIYKRIIK